MLGVAINVVAVLFGAAIGLLLKNKLGEGLKDILITALGISTLVAAIQDIMLTPNVPILVLSLIIGGALGTVLHIQSGLEKLGGLLQKKLSHGEQSSVGTAFVQSTMIFCIGAMTIYGSIAAGLGNNGTLYWKRLVDGV